MRDWAVFGGFMAGTEQLLGGDIKERVQALVELLD